MNSVSRSRPSRVNARKRSAANTNAPANIGSFQFFCVLALSLFGVEKTTAAGFSIMYFLTLTVPLWILGLLAISRCGLSLSTIRIDLAASGAFLNANSAATDAAEN